MELSEFITKTLTDITHGIRGANKELFSGRNGSSFSFSPNSEGLDRVNFDIAVTVTDDSKGGGGAKINVMQIISAGVDHTRASSTESVSRIQFSIHAKSVETEVVN